MCTNPDCLCHTLDHDTLYVVRVKAGNTWMYLQGYVGKWEDYLSATHKPKEQYTYNGDEVGHILHRSSHSKQVLDVRVLVEV